MVFQKYFPGNFQNAQNNIHEKVLLSKGTVFWPVNFKTGSAWEISRPLP